VRLATTVLLRDLGLNLFNLLSFENYYNNDISRYFQSVGERGDYEDLKPDFTAWLEYFAAGILDELLRLQKRLEATPITRLQAHHEKLLAYLDKHGSITDKEYAKLVDRAKATRALDFRFLIERGLLERKGGGPKTYYVKALV
jgi:Fic family protein